MTSTTDIIAALAALNIIIPHMGYGNIFGFIVGASGREYRVIVNPARVTLHACNHPTMGDGFEVGRATLPTNEKLVALLAQAV
jgi:hypothetical protein